MTDVKLNEINELTASIHRPTLACLLEDICTLISQLIRAYVVRWNKLRLTIIVQCWHRGYVDHSTALRLQHSDEIWQRSQLRRRRAELTVVFDAASHLLVPDERSRAAPDVNGCRTWVGAPDVDR